jgi:hypothetical protein
VLTNVERRLVYNTPAEQEIGEFEDRNDASDAEKVSAKIRPSIQEMQMC